VAAFPRNYYILKHLQRTGIAKDISPIASPYVKAYTFSNSSDFAFFKNGRDFVNPLASAPRVLIFTFEGLNISEKLSSPDGKPPLAKLYIHLMSKNPTKPPHQCSMPVFANIFRLLITDADRFLAESQCNIWEARRPQINDTSAI
jgi:hypothetical protein